MDVLRQVFSVLLVFSLLGAALWALRRAEADFIPGLRKEANPGKYKVDGGGGASCFDAPAHPASGVHSRARDSGRDASAGLLRGYPAAERAIGSAGVKSFCYSPSSPEPAMAAQGDSLLGITLVQNKTGASLGVPMQIVLLLTALTLLPAILMSVTPFLRFIVVLHFLRQALGTQTTPSNQVLVGLALFLSLLVMQPVANDIYHKSWEPLEAGQISASDAWDQRHAAHSDLPAEIRPRKRHPLVHGAFAFARRPPSPPTCP